MTYFASFILIGLTFGVIYGINAGKNYLRQHKQFSVKLLQGLSIISTIIIIAVNKALRIVIRKFSLYEK